MAFPLLLNEIVRMRAFAARLITFLLLLSCFSAYAHVELDNPKGGETFLSGSVVTIQWHVTIQHNTLNWDLYFSPDGGMTWQAIQTDLPAGTLTYQWHVPDDATSLARVSVIQDNDTQDYQDESQDFTIQATGISYPTMQNATISIYPNPASEFLNVDVMGNDDLLIETTLLNANGKLVREYQHPGKKFTIPVDDLTAGIYFLYVNSNSAIFYKKVIVE